ncbi:MAG: hypothetical protein R6X02_36205 [Enhygromyxa sp.]
MTLRKNAIYLVVSVLPVACGVHCAPSARARVARLELLVGKTDEIYTGHRNAPRKMHHVDLFNVTYYRWELPPPACGVHVATTFRRIAAEEFSAHPVGSCLQSSAKVDCPTHFMKDTDIYFHLEYEYSALSMRIRLDALELDERGKANTAEHKLTSEQSRNFVSMFDRVVNAAYCEE